MEAVTVQKNKLIGVKASKKNASHFFSPLIVQRKLSIGTRNDSYEIEANRVADQVVNMSNSQVQTKLKSGPLLQKKCATCSEEEKLQKKPIAESIKPIIQKASLSGGGEKVASNAVSSKINSSKGGGNSMGSDTLNFMESRFGTNFSEVKIHTDSNAVQLSRDLNAQAFTVGNDIYFNEGKYNPNSTSGKHLLAHELTHTVQQSSQLINEVNSVRLRTPIQQISKFSDTGHYIIEEYALSRGGLDATAIARINSANTTDQITRVKDMYDLTDEQVNAIKNASLRGELRLNGEEIDGIHRGNVQRDYSQLPLVLNALLLNRIDRFGGYSAREHFDNFDFDEENNRWRARAFEPFGNFDLQLRNTHFGLQESRRRFLFQDLNRPDPTPIDYIESEVLSVADNWRNPNITKEQNMVHLGNAFHTIEDFFAHSNFVELLQSDSRFGDDLITGSVSNADSKVSISHILADISSDDSSEVFERRAQNAISDTRLGSHSRLAKDTPNTPNYIIARRLAALVIKQLTTDFLIAMLPQYFGSRRSLVRSTFMVKVRRYLRPPSEEDKWWESLQNNAPSNIDSELNRLQRRTPLTVNQSIASPLRNIEASSNSPMRFPIGLAVPVRLGDVDVFIQLGAFGISVLSDGEHEGNEDADFLWGGLQATGRF